MAKPTRGASSVTRTSLLDESWKAVRCTYSFPFPFRAGRGRQVEGGDRAQGTGDSGEREVLGMEGRKKKEVFVQVSAIGSFRFEEVK